MQQTITSINQNHEPIIYKLMFENSKIELSPEKIINDLLAIFHKYLNWEDLVSLKIKEWGEKVLLINPSVDINNPESLLKKVEADVNELFNKVLISSFLSPLKEPILDGQYTWDKSELENYCNKYAYFGLPSPIDGKKLDGSTLKEHSFAIEILKWAENLPLKQTENLPLLISSIHHDEQSQAIVPLQIGLDCKQAMKELIIYRECGEIAKKQYNDYKMCQTIKNATEDLKASTAEVEEYVRLSVERAKRHAEQQKEEVLNCINQMNSSHQSTVEILNARIDDHKQDIKIAFEMLTYAEQKCALQQARIDHLNTLYQQKINEVNHLTNKSKRGSCTIF